MRIELRPLSLGRRIVASVALGLALILLLFGLVVLWTVRESSEAAYHERVILAEALVSRVNDVLRYALGTLEREAGGLRIEPGQPLTEAQFHRLADLRLELGIFALVSITDADGITVWTEPRRADVVVGRPLVHPGAQAALRTGNPQSNEFRPPGNGQSVYACLAVPLRDQDGRVSGVLMAEIDASHPALNLLPAGKVGDGVHVQLVNASGQVVAGGEPLEPKGAPQHDALLKDLVALRAPGYRIHDPEPLAGMGSHVVAYAPVSLIPSWGIVVEQPRDVVLAMPRQLQQRLMLLGFAALLIAASVAWFDVRRVVRPLKHLTSAAERFAAGRLDEPVQLDRADELGILARAFETMRRRLRASLSEVAEWNRELERRVAARTAEVERRNRELAHLNAIAETVSGSLEVKAMLDRTLERVIQITGAEAGCFWTTTGNGAQLALVAEHCIPTGLRTEQVCTSTDRCFCGRAAQLNQVIVAAAEDRDPQAVQCPAANLRSALAVPLVSGERVQGVLFLGSQQPDYFQQAELATLAAIGRQVGIALANAHLYQSLRARERERAELLQRVMDGQEEERRRLAQELHDDTSQTLATLRLGLERLAARIEKPDHAKRLADHLQSVAAQTLSEVHRLALELRPSVLDDVGLVAAIGRYLREYALRWNLAVDLAPVGMEDLRLIPAAETAIYRIVQAGLTNIGQHARARHVSLLIERRDGNLVVVVEDDGQGFDLAAVRAAPLEGRLGLAGMEERAALIGATLTFETAPDAGTTLFLEVPLGSNCRREEAHVEAAYTAG